MRFLVYAATMILALLAFGSVQAQTMKPGMWEMTRTMTDPGMSAHMEEMRKRLASMPADQRQRVEAMMAASGQSLGSQPGQLVSKTCITPEQAAKLDFNSPAKGDCTRESMEKKGSTVHVKSKCPNGTKTDAVITFHGDTAFDSQVTLTLPNEPAPKTVKLSGKWLTATCDKTAM